MENPMFLTISAGVLIFVIGQFILKLILEPIVSFKENIGSLSGFCLRNRAKITNASATPELADELKTLTATILAKKEAIPCYNYFRFLVGLPSENSLVKGCQLLTGVSYKMVKETSQGLSAKEVQILLNLQEISKLLKVRLDYSKL